MPRPHEHRSSPLILIDESLAAGPLQTVLSAVGYQAVSVQQAVGAGAQDSVILSWLGLRQGIWVTADEKAKRQHAGLIKSAGIHIIWVHRPKEGLNLRQQALLLLSTLDLILEDAARARSPRLYLVKFSGQRPRWERLDPT